MDNPTLQCHDGQKSSRGAGVGGTGCQRPAFPLLDMVGGYASAHEKLMGGRPGRKDPAIQKCNDPLHPWSSIVIALHSAIRNILVSFAAIAILVSFGQAGCLNNVSRVPTGRRNRLCSYAMKHSRMQGKLWFQ